MGSIERNENRMKREFPVIYKDKALIAGQVKRKKRTFPVRDQKICRGYCVVVSSFARNKKMRQATFSLARDVKDLASTVSLSATN